MRVRVAMVLQAYPPVIGGAQRQVQRLAPLLAAREIDVVVVTRRPPGTPRSAAEDGARVERVSEGWGGARAAVSFVARATRATLAARPAVVHVHDLLSPASVGIAVHALAGIPLVAKVASSGPHGDLDILLARPAGAVRARALMQSTAVFACLTAAVEEELLAAGARRSQLRRLPNGVDVATFRPAHGAAEVAELRARFGLPAGRPLALYAGRLRAVKRLDAAAEACAAAGIELALAGDGPEADALAARQGVHLLGPVDDIAALHRCADVYVSASQTEGMSGAMMEALASGVPVAAVEAGGVRDLLASGGGAIAAGDGPADLAEALRRALGTPGAGLEGRRLAAGELSLDAAADRLAELYRELAARPRRRLS